MSNNNGVLRLFDEIAEHDSDDLWLFGLGDRKTADQDLSYQQRTPSPRRNFAPSPLCNIPVREEEHHHTPQPFSISPLVEEERYYSDSYATVASSSQRPPSRKLIANGADLNCVDRPTTSSALSLADSDGAEVFPPILSPAESLSDASRRQTTAVRLPSRPPNSRPNGAVQLQQRVNSAVSTRPQDLRPSVSCDLQPAPPQQQQQAPVIQASQLAGCLQLVNGQLVVQAQLQQVQTPNGMMTVAVLPSMNRLQMAQNGVPQLTATPTPSPQNQQILPTPPSVVLDKSKKPRSIMPRPLNGSSRKRPPIAPVSAKNAQPAQQTMKTPSSAQSGMIVRLSSENAEIVNRISGEIARLQTDQNNSGLDHSDVIRQLEQHRARIFGEALRTQHSVQAPQIAPSPPPPPPPPPVCRQPNQRIVSINGQNYLMFDGHPLALHSASANESVAISSSPSMPSGPSVQSMESLPPTPNGPTGPVISERNAKRSARPSRSSATFSKSTTHAANAKPSDAQIARRQSQLKAERTNRLREQFAAQSDRLEAVDTVTPFSSLGDAVERLLPFHVYDEPEFNADALRTFDDNYLRYSARLMYQKRMLEHRFRAALYREAMTPFAEKAEESLLAYLHSRHEQELLDRDRELAKADLEGFVAQSEICAAGRAEGMNADLQNDILNSRKRFAPSVKDEVDSDEEVGDSLTIEEIEEEIPEEGQRVPSMKYSPMESSSRPPSAMEEDERSSPPPKSPSPSPVRLRIKLESPLRLESPIRKKKKKRRKRRRHSPASPDRRRSLSPVQSPPPLLPAEPVAADASSLKLRFRLTANGAADLVRLNAFVDPPKVVPKLKIRLGNVHAMMTAVAAEPSHPPPGNAAPFNGLEQSDSESDSVRSLRRARSSSNELGSDAGVVQFSPDSDAHFSDDDQTRLRQLTNSLIERVNVESLMGDARAVPIRKIDNSSPPIGGLDLSGSEHSD